MEVTVEKKRGRGRPKGSKNRPKSAIDILKSSKPAMTRKPRGPNKSKDIQAPHIDRDPVGDIAWWQSRYYKMENAIKEFLSFLHCDVRRDGVEAEYYMDISLKSQYKNMKFSRDAETKRYKSTGKVVEVYADPLTKIWDFIHNEDAFRDRGGI